MPETKTIVDDPARAERLAAVLKALAHPLRLRLVAALCLGEQSVGSLAEMVGEKQSLVSQHLAILRMVELVSSSRRGGRAIYFIKDEGLRNLIACLTECRRGA